MQNLGITDHPQPQDNIFKRLFWPSDSPGEVDALGVQGFWLCLAIAVFSTVVLLVDRHWVIASLALLVFFLGGAGIREHSTSAAVVIAILYILGIIENVVVGLPPGVLTFLFALLLIANVRGTFLAARWQKRLPPEELPIRWSETWRDKLVDQIPAAVWPLGKILFFGAAICYLLIGLLGTGVFLMHSRTMLH